MNKSLIITGWSRTEYVAGAAAALEALKGKADVIGVSMNRLAGVLSEFGPKYTAVYVLGVGLTMNIGAVLAALKELKSRKVKTAWISAMPVAPEFAAEVCLEGIDPAERGFDELLDSPKETLVDAVAEYFGTLNKESVKFYRAYTKEVSDRNSAVGRYQLLIKAAGFAHRTRGDDSIYEATIRSLYLRVKPDLWEPCVKEAFEDYVRFGRRELGGVSAAMSEIRARIQKIAKHERARVLVLGESGTGKETIAEQIHMQSPRKKGPFVAFNCASVAKELLEDRFFGHEKGAFTGADKLTRGLFERADRGTLFLDEIAEMPLEAQALLLRAIQEGTIIRVGGTEEIPVDVRLVAATNRNLPRLVREGKFRADLYQRISTILINVPPLRERREDIGDIASGFWLDMGWGRLTSAQMKALEGYDYPGNVRELLNILDRARALDESDFAKIMKEHIAINKDLFVGATNDGSANPSASELPENLTEAMTLHVKSVFDKHNHNLTATKDALGISLNTLKKYLAKT